MRRALASILAGAACLSIAGPLPLFAQASQPAPGGGFYDLDDYTYFPQPQPQQRFEPIMPILPDDPIPPDVPVFPQPPQTPAPSPSPTPTPAPPPGNPPPAGGGGGGSVPVAPYVPGGPLTFPKGDISAAKADGKTFVTGARAASGQISTSTNLTGTIPGYTGQTLPQEALADDPDGLTAQGASGALSNDAWRLVTNPDRTVVTLDADGLLRAQAVAEDPDAYLAGSTLGSTNGQCAPLPPSGAGTEYYEATCEEGAQLIEEARTCRVPLVIQTEGSQYWQYQCYSDEPQPGHSGVCSLIRGALQNGSCTLIDRDRVGETCLQWVRPPNGRPWCAEPGEPLYREVWSCPAQLPGVPGGALRNTTRIVSETRDEGQCQAATEGLTCTQSAEVCTGQPETRTINGLAVTRPCWEWERTYQCNGTGQATDCGDIAGNPQCTFVRDECLDDPQVGACQLTTKVYRCPIPGGGTSDPAQYICGDDVYCIDGECEPIEREASTEFKDALVGLHTLGQANAEFNEADLTLFAGSRETCTKKVFGLSNCCSGKGVPLLTPFLCNAAERELDKKDDKGLCHRVGSYCSDRVLGVCVTRKDAYCCFESKLSRILQQQGRQQINKPWGAPKSETCKGFTLDEFSRLDLSVMDFSEVYADFIDAAKLPDELDTSQQIQQRIEDYLQQHGPQ